MAENDEAQLRQMEVDLLSDASAAIYADHHEILTLARLMVEDLVADGYPQHIAERYGRKIVDEYFECLGRIWRAGETDAPSS